MDLFNKIKDKVNERRSNYLPTNFYLEVESNGQLPYNTATVKVKAFKDKDKKIEMTNVSFEWFREIEKRKYQIDNTSNCNYFSFKDIGAKVLVAVTNNENNSQVEIGNFGPIVLDPNIKNDIENMLVQEQGNFEVQLQYRNNKDLFDQDIDKIEINKLKIDQIQINPREIVLNIGNDKINLFHHEYDFVEDFTNPQCFYLKIFKQDEIFENLNYEKNEQSHIVFKIKFLGRVFKEIFCVLRSLFLNIRLMPFLRKLENMETIQNDQKIFNSNKNISYGDLALVFENFKLTLKKNIMYTKKIILEKEALQEQCDNLENDMRTTLTELKEVHKQREFNQMDFSKIEQLETTLIQIEKKKKDKSFLKDSVKNNQILQIQLKKAKDDLEKMKKLNKILLKEIQKKKKSEKIQKMNQSLNNLKEVNSLLRQQNFQTQIHDTINLSNNSNFGLKNQQNNFSKLDQSQVYQDLQDLQQENENLKNEMQKLTNKNFKKQLSLIQEESTDQKVAYYQQLFKSMREQIDDLTTGKFDKKNNKSFLNDSIVESVYQAHQHNQLELLNMENNILMRRITYLEQETNQQNSQKDKLSRKSKQSYEDDWNQQIDNLREQNTQLMNEIERLRNLELETENVYKKQNQILKQEIEKLKDLKENSTDHSQHNIIEEKNKVIQQMQQTINKLVLEVQQLQEEINVNRSLFQTDNNGSQHQF